jgi:hypothetical protein
MRLARQILAGLLIGLLTFIAVWRPSEPGPGAVAVESVDDDESAGIRILRILAKSEVASDVAAGRCSLAEAAALFGELDRLEPPATDLARVSPYDSLPTHEERLCRQVIAWVNVEKLRAGLPADAAVARLEAELRGLKEHGPIRLPDTANRDLIEDLFRHARALFAEKQRRPTRTGQSPATH